jgi:predicted membrane-bound spermidine synthase
MRDSPRLALAFFASGAAALIFQLLWFRALGRVLGGTVWTAAVVLTAFMLGVALGGFLAARWAARIRNPARAFAFAEVVVAAGGTLLVWVLPALEPAFGRLLAPLADHPALSTNVRLLLALAAMMVPTIAMGMTLPLGVRLLARTDTARALGLLYAANTFGAALAPVIAEYYLVGALGLRGTALAAMVLNLGAGLLALRTPVPEYLAAIAAAAPPRWNARLMIAAAAAGMIAMALEVVWFRLLLLYAPPTDTTFALLLMLMLGGIAIGGLCAPLLARLGFAWIAAGSSFAVVLGYAAASGGGARAQDVLASAMVLMVPAAALSGSLFTLLGAELRGGSADPQPAIGQLTLSNTLGAAAGAGLACFLLLPGLGIENAILVLAAGYALLPLLVLERGAWRRLAPAAAGLAALLLFPAGRMEHHLHNAAAPYKALDGAVLALAIQGPTTTLQVLRADRLGEPWSWRLVTDSYSMTAVNREGLRYMQFFGWLPLALHPEPRRALLISYGAGNTARALLDDPALERLTVVDVSPEILAASRLMHGAKDPLADPRVRLVVEDGRHFLRTHEERFDLVTGEPPPPMMTGMVNLYSREYFHALAERLAPGGLATYWLPVTQFQPRGARAVIAAFCDAFPDCTLWAGAQFEWVLMGGREFSHRPSLQRVARLWKDPYSAPRLEASAFEHPAQLGAAFLADAAQLRRWVDGEPPVTDDYPKRMRTGVLPEQTPKEYLGLLDAQAAAANFRASRWVAAHWPQDLAGATLEFYRVQSVYNHGLPREPEQRLILLDSLLRQTRLSTPVLWLLDTDMVEQGIIDRARVASGGEPAAEHAYPLGALRLARGDYAGAAKLLAQAAEQDPRRAGAVAAYAACRAGQAGRARAVKGAERLPPALRCWQ